MINQMTGYTTTDFCPDQQAEALFPSTERRTSYVVFRPGMWLLDAETGQYMANEPGEFTPTETVEWAKRMAHDLAHNGKSTSYICATLEDDFGLGADTNLAIALRAVREASARVRMGDRQIARSMVMDECDRDNMITFFIGCAYTEAEAVQLVKEAELDVRGSRRR